MFAFALLDPRNVPAAIEANDKVFANPVYGIEVTVPVLAQRCTHNLDPQHAGGDASRTAIEDALTVNLPAEGSTLATVRADLDAVGAMAILNLRAKGSFPKTLPEKMPASALLSPCSECAGDGLRVHEPGCSVDAEASAFELFEQIRKVAEADKFARGGWPGPRLLPTRSDPWCDGATATAESSRELAAIAAAVMDFKVPLADRVATMEKWLLTAEEPKSYRNQIEKERLDMITALENGGIKYEMRSNNKIAVVESTHWAATSVGYALAPVVLALNPSFKQGQGEPYRKFTICAFKPTFADIKSALAELNELEAGWGGSPTIGGSPQGVSSTLTIDQVVAVVEKYLR